MPLHTLFTLHRRSRTTFHNLCTLKTPPSGTDQLLWHGLKFCIEPALPKPNFEDTFSRLGNDIRLQYWLETHGGGGGDEDYNPKLYIKSEYSPSDTTDEIEQALEDFHNRITTEIKANSKTQRRQHNLPTAARQLLRTLPSNPDFIVLPTDKNLGPAIIERSVYKSRCLQDHLANRTTYRRLTEKAAYQRLQTATTAFDNLVQANGKLLSDADKTYFERAFKECRRIPQFYCTPKVHKTPWKTRPIVSCINSRLGDLSKWVDVQLQRVVHLCPGYLKDSRSLLQRLSRLGKLPATARIVTADAVSMYTNIDTAHGLETMKKWFDLHAHELPYKFPTQMVLDAIKLVMYNNVFQFDDTYWLQLTGTAMGTSLACIYATIYYSYHEETGILPRFASNTGGPVFMPVPLTPVQTLVSPPLLLYARLIDDAVLIWDTALIPTHMLFNFRRCMEHTMKFGTLDWEVEKLSKQADFLDLTIKIGDDGFITTKTFIKSMNLHLYIPPNSAHPKGVLKSLIFGNVQRYWIQNSDVQDFIDVTGAFYGHLLNRGYTREVLTPIFQEAAAHIGHRSLQRAARGEPLVEHPPATPRRGFFVHWKYHPRDIGRTVIRQIFTETLAPTLEDHGLFSRQFTVAYSIQQNLSGCLTRTRLEETPNDRVSSYAESMGLTPANL